MSLSYPYQFERSGNRFIPYPLVPITLETIRGKRSYLFIMDTGADTTTLPNHMIFLLGLSKKNLAPSSSQGIGKDLVRIWEGTVHLQLGSDVFPVACSFTDNDRTPLLLGKLDIFDRYNILFDNDSQIVNFRKRSV